MSSIDDVLRRKEDESLRKLKEGYEQYLKSIRDMKEQALREASRRLDEAAKEFVRSLTG
ncbi:hypothetical protein [Acidilobus saccharovorans]|uniref:hypothetical protein n=1 Tax=Acidilobus saccharovorans TaxID=242703 RepID=UPI0013050841|nr:hypothetical protein [Acidilobus saccharovorans]